MLVQLFFLCCSIASISIFTSTLFYFSLSWMTYPRSFVMAMVTSNTTKTQATNYLSCSFTTQGSIIWIWTQNCCFQHWLDPIGSPFSCKIKIYGGGHHRLRLKNCYTCIKCIFCCRFSHHNKWLQNQSQQIFKYCHHRHFLWFLNPNGININFNGSATVYKC